MFIPRGFAHGFSVAPQNTPQEGLPYHEWFIEFDPDASGEPENLDAFAEAIDKSMRQQNIYHDDLI